MRSPTPAQGDKSALFASDTDQEVIDALRRGLEIAGALIAVTGEPGSGKTALVRAAIAQYVGGVRFVSAATEDGLWALDELYAEAAAEGLWRGGVLVVDDAHHLPDRAFHRLATVFQGPREKLPRVVLVGLPQLWVRLRDPALRSLRQRVDMRTALMPRRQQRGLQRYEGPPEDPGDAFGNDPGTGAGMGAGARIASVAALILLLGLAAMIALPGPRRSLRPDPVAETEKGAEASPTEGMPPQSPEAVAALLRRARAMLAMHDVVAARRMLELAAVDGGSGEAAFALAETYDPLEVSAGEADPGSASAWYRAASALGSADAEPRLQRLEGSR